MRSDAVQEPAVVADDHGAATEAQERLFQGPQRIHVQVVGRLVQKQQVAAATEQLGEMHAVALAAGKLADLALLVGALEIEARDIAARSNLALAEHQELCPAGDFLENGLAAIQGVAILVDVGR